MWSKEHVLEVLNRDRARIAEICTILEVGQKRLRRLVKNGLIRSSRGPFRGRDVLMIDVAQALEMFAVREMFAAPIRTSVLDEAHLSHQILNEAHLSHQKRLANTPAFRDYREHGLRIMDFRYQDDLLEHLTVTLSEPRDIEWLKDLRWALCAGDPDDQEAAILENYQNPLDAMIRQSMRVWGVDRLRIEFPPSRGWAAFGVDAGEDDHSFAEVSGLGSPDYYAMHRRQKRSLIDMIEEEAGSELTEENADRIAAALSSKVREGFWESVREELIRFALPRAPKADVHRIFLGHDFRAVHYRRSIDGRSLDSVADAVFAASLYFPEIVMHFDPMSGSAETLRFLAQVRPLIRRGSLHLVNANPPTETWLDYWLFHHHILWTGHEDEVSRLVDADQSESEFVEVYTQFRAFADLCGASNVYSWRDFWRFASVIDTAGGHLSDIGRWRSGTLFNNLLLPALAQTQRADALRVLESGEHLASFRDDLSCMLDRIPILDENELATELPGMAQDFLSLRKDALVQDLGSTTLRSRVNEAVVSISIGATVGFLTTFDLLSAALSGVASEGLALGYKQIRDRRDVETRSALARVYGHLAAYPES